MDLEPHRPSSLPIVTGPLLVAVGILCHVLLTEVLTRHSSTFVNHPWLVTTVNDLGMVALIVGSVVLAGQLLRRP